MYAIEFEASIDDGIVRIPKVFKNIQKTKKAKIIVMIDEAVEQEDLGQLSFEQFLNHTKKVEKISLFSKDDLHE